MTEKCSPAGKEGRARQGAQRQNRAGARVASAHSEDTNVGSGAHRVCCSLRAMRNHWGVCSLCFLLLLLFKIVLFKPFLNFIF